MLSSTWTTNSVYKGLLVGVKSMVWLEVSKKGYQKTAKSDLKQVKKNPYTFMLSVKTRQWKWENGFGETWKNEGGKRGLLHSPTIYNRIYYYI